MIHNKSFYVKIKDFLVLILRENLYLKFEAEGNCGTLVIGIAKK